MFLLGKYITYLTRSIGIDYYFILNGRFVFCSLVDKLIIRVELYQLFQVKLKTSISNAP